MRQCVNTRLESASCAIEGDRLAVWQVNPHVDPGGASGLDLLVGGGGRAEAVTPGVTKGTCLIMRTEVEEGGGGACA